MNVVPLISRGGFGEVHEVEVGQLRVARKTFVAPSAFQGDVEAVSKLTKRYFPTPISSKETPSFFIFAALMSSAFFDASSRSS